MSATLHLSGTVPLTTLQNTAVVRLVGECVVSHFVLETVSLYRALVISCGSSYQYCLDSLVTRSSNRFTQGKFTSECNVASERYRTINNITKHCSCKISW